MVESPNESIRRLVADALTAIDAANGGRYMSAVAKRVRVDRTTVSRWRRGEVTPSVDQCKTLAEAYPTYFDPDLLLRLHAQHALGQHDANMLTVGVKSARTTADTFITGLDALNEPPPDPEDREVLLCALHLDHTDAPGPQEFLDSQAIERYEMFIELVSRRASEGWRVRTVVSAGNPVRLPYVRRLLEAFDGPDVELRAYDLSLPLVLCPLIVARRDVGLAFDDPRTGQPTDALMLRSPSAVLWGRRYFERLFVDAPFWLRTVGGIDEAEFDRFEQSLSLGRRAPKSAPGL